MARLLIQSKATGCFLVPSSDGEPGWSNDLKKAGGGVVADMDQVAQLVEDWCEFEDFPQVIDLDKLGTSLDGG